MRVRRDIAEGRTPYAHAHNHSPNTTALLTHSARVTDGAVSSGFKRGDAGFSEEKPCAPKPLADAAWPGSGEPAAAAARRQPDCYLTSYM